MNLNTKLLTTAACTALTLAGALPVSAASHREAPMTALDHKADITDFFAFVSYDDPSKVTMIMNVDPLLEPSNGPNYFPFDPEITYAINIDNDFDAERDVTFEFKFRTEIRRPGDYAGLSGGGPFGLSAPTNSPPPVAPGTIIVPPEITALDGAGSEGLSLRQKYSVSMRVGNSVPVQLGADLIAVPSNVGLRTIPDYEALADQGIYDLADGVSVFAGTVDDPFWIDLGATFDTLNFRPESSGILVPGILDDVQAVDDNNSAPDDVAGFNVNAIAIQVPIAMLTQDGQTHTADEPLATIGTWATTARPRIRFLRGGGLPALTSKASVQVQRMANPLFNELLIGTGDKDKFSMSAPKDDAQFADYALDPSLARVLNALYSGLPIPTPPRSDLLPLVQYLPPIAAAGTPPGPVADLLRLNTGVPPTPPTLRSRLGLLTVLDDNTANDDLAGFPNGRRVSDDVTDIAARVVAGVLAGPPFNAFPYANIGDGVNANDVPYRETFPYLGYAHSGIQSRHVDTGETGCSGTCP